MKMHAFLSNHPEQRVEHASSRDRFRIQNQGLSVSMSDPIQLAKWTLKHVQGDAA
ncbi:MAG: hypothetical protein ACKOPO_06870 [Novosphingobium sp.]